MFKKVLALLCTLMLLLSCCACHADTETPATPTALPASRSTALTYSDSNQLTISRAMRETEMPMGEDGTWTVFVYLCGTDLESGQGSATGDIAEMLAVSLSDNIRYVVQTGGCSQWQNETVSADTLQRYVITGGEIALADEQPSASMGQPDTLQSFLSWGVQNYPAAKMGLILWNHGSGSINGVCFDELYESDSLSLVELDNALSGVYEKMTDRFEFIGFDACLMSTVETANILVPHARYMIASEETEPGNGWDYTAISNCLTGNPSATGAELGTAICDGFYESCKQTGEEDMATLAVCDLSKVDAILNAFDKVAAQMSGQSEDVAALGAITKTVKKAENYGGNTPTEGYTNMVDLGDMMTGIADTVSDTDAVIAAIDDAIVYQIKGASRARAHGLSLYYPLEVQGSSELNTVREITISKNYLSFIDRLVYGANNGTTDQYADNGVSDSFWSEDAYQSDNWTAVDNSDTGSFESAEQSAVALAQDAALDEDGLYSLVIDPQTLDYVDNVQFSLFYDTGEQPLYFLGNDDDIYVDWETGVVEDNFNGTWVTLPDGQLLTLYLSEQGDDYNLYTSPVLLNGEQTNLQLLYSFPESRFVVLGTWGGIEESGQAARDTVQLKDGDTLAPCYSTYNSDTGEEGTQAGNNFTVSGELTITYQQLLPGDYYYSFIITDIFGLSTYSESTVFNVDENGDVYFYTDN